jgi:hypothetical protein
MANEIVGSEIEECAMRAALGLRSWTWRCAMKADCDLIMDGDTKPAGGREGRGRVGGLVCGGRKILTRSDQRSLG